MTCPRTDVYIDMDYVTLRNQNLNKIEDYYNKFLNEYTEKYTLLQNKQRSNDVEDNNEARTGNSPLNLRITSLNTYMIKEILTPLINKIRNDNDHYNERNVGLQKNQIELKKLRKQKHKSLDKLKAYESKEKKNEQHFNENKEVNDYFIYKHAMIIIGFIIIIMLTLYFMVGGIQKRANNKQFENINPLLL